MLSFWLTKGGRWRKEGTMPITRLQLKCCCLSSCGSLAIPGHRGVAHHHFIIIMEKRRRGCWQPVARFQNGAAGEKKSRTGT